MKKRHRRTAFLPALILLAGMISFTGCAGKEEAGKEAGLSDDSAGKTPPAMGRYVEKSIELPVLGKAEEILSLLHKDGDMVIYTFMPTESDSTGSYFTYSMEMNQMEQEIRWNKEEAGWLGDALGNKKRSLLDIRMGENQAVYTCYFDESYMAHVIKTTDGIGYEEIKIDDLTQKKIPNAFSVTDQGEILITYLGGEDLKGIFVYDPKEGKEVKHFELDYYSSDNISNLLDSKQNKLAALSNNGKELTIYNIEDGSVMEERSVDAIQSSELTEGIVKIGSNNDYFILSQSGLQHLEADGTIMETIIDGSLNKIGLEGVIYKDMLFGEEEYIILFEDSGIYELNYYVYDKAVPSLPSTQLTIYGLQKNTVISRAIGIFQKEHPDVQILYETSNAGEGAQEIADSIRSLNTELMNKTGADILILDGLPMQSYVEKGILVNLSDTIKPMTDKGELLDNIVAGYQNPDSSIYGIPARFHLPVLIGDEEMTEAFSSLASLKEYVTTHREEKYFYYTERTVTYEELTAFLLQTYYQELFADGMNLDQEKLIAFLETTKSLANAMGATISAEAIPPLTQQELEADLVRRRQYLDSLKYHLGAFAVHPGSIEARTIQGIFDMMEPFAIQEQFGKTIKSVNHQYIPEGILGINASTDKLDLAKDFIRCVLSESEQSRDLGVGMPINSKALDLYAENESEISGAIAYDENGEMKTIDFEWPEREEILFITDLSKKLTSALNMDTVLKEIILNETKPLWEGSITPNQAADSILQKANTYISE